jgi:D-aminoacyl-tRNA deacylase
MRVVIQRVRQGSVRVAGEINGQCGKGFVILVGVGQGDTHREADYLAGKIANLRDLEPKAELLVISQFTLYADTRKGRRPSFLDAAAPDIAAPLVEYLVGLLRGQGLKVETGRFGAEMLVDIQNDGPVTIIMDTAGLL